MERFYLRVTEDFADVYFRPTHQLIEFLPNAHSKESVERVKELLGMSTEEFYELLVDNGIRPRKKAVGDSNADKENWYQSAWKKCTEEFFLKNKLDITKMPNEEVPYDYIEELLKKQKIGWHLKKAKTLKKLKPLKKHNDTKEELEELQEKYEKGALTKKEYNEAKKQYLDTDTEEVKPVKKLKKLH